MARTRKTAAKKSSAKKASAKRASAKTTAAKKHTSVRTSKKAATIRPQLTHAINTSSPDFIVHGNNDKALFSLAAYRGEGMCLLAMNWKQGTPPNNFVGFAIEYQEPEGTQFYAVLN